MNDNINTSVLNSGLDLRNWQPIFVSPTHFDSDELHQLEDDLAYAGATITYDVNEAGIILSRVTKIPRILFDLRTKGVILKLPAGNEPKSGSQNANSSSLPHLVSGETKQERHQIAVSSTCDADIVVIDDDSTESDSSMGKRPANDLRRVFERRNQDANSTARSAAKPQVLDRLVTVVRVEWFKESLKQGRAQPLEKFISFQGTSDNILESVVIQNRMSSESSKNTFPVGTSIPKEAHLGVYKRAKEDMPDQSMKRNRVRSRKFEKQTASANPASWEAGQQGNSQYAHLLQQTTTEHESGYSGEIPEMPEWVKKGVKYSCLRCTPKHHPNEIFVELLKKIKEARLLTNDEIGVRAYATSIASIVSYPYKITSPREIIALPGCDTKIANLFVEWANTGTIRAVEELEANDDLKTLKLFFNIWGVGATTAREFYYDRGWRDLDDIVEFGWSTLTRVQQIGVKFYDEFLDLIPRLEVESIAQVIHQHAVKVRDQNIQSMIVGGYRRGKEASGDVDVIVSHPEEEKTLNLIGDIVASLEEDGWITHTLLLSLNSTNRGQQTLPYRVGKGGHGFDTLDKALVVWQDPRWGDNNKHDRGANATVKNPNIHRRVDIIIAPWRSSGCAVVGWSGGTTFERDLRSFVRKTKGWKFDSSGVRDRSNGKVVDLEGYFIWQGEEGSSGRAKTLEEAERRVFDGMGIPFRQPWDRCTG